MMPNANTRAALSAHLRALEEALLDPEDLARLPNFKRRMEWFLRHHPDVAEHVDMSRVTPQGPRLLLTIANRQKIERIYRYVLDENEFLSPFGLRSVSRWPSRNGASLRWKATARS